MADLKRHLNIANIIAIILGIIGLVWLIYTIWRNWKINSIRSWPKTDAMVINVAAQPSNKNAGNTYIDPNAIIVTTGDNAQYIPRILYRYRVGGREFQSNNLVYSGSDSYNAYQTKMLIGQLTPGATIPVFYNPNNHAEAYVYNGLHNYWGIVGGIILLLIAAFIAHHHMNKVKTSKTTIDYSPSLTDIDESMKGNTIVRKNTTTIASYIPTSNRVVAGNMFRRDFY